MPLTSAYATLPVRVLLLTSQYTRFLPQLTARKQVLQLQSYINPFQQELPSQDQNAGSPTSSGTSSSTLAWSLPVACGGALIVGAAAAIFFTQRKKLQQSRLVAERAKVSWVVGVFSCCYFEWQHLR